MPRIIKTTDFILAEPGFLPPLLTPDSKANPNLTVTINNLPVVVQGVPITPHTLPSVPPVPHLVQVIIPGQILSRVTINGIPVALESDFVKGVDGCLLPMTPVAGIVSTVFAGPGI